MRSQNFVDHRSNVHGGLKPSNRNNRDNRAEGGAGTFFDGPARPSAYQFSGEALPNFVS